MAIKAARTASWSLASHTASVVVLVDPWLVSGRTEEGCRLPFVGDRFSTAARFRGFVLNGFFKGKEAGVVVGNADVATPLQTPCVVPVLLPLVPGLHLFLLRLLSLLPGLLPSLL
jgi:hypothetical protein